MGWPNSPVLRTTTCILATISFVFNLITGNYRSLSISNLHVLYIGYQQNTSPWKKASLKLQVTHCARWSLAMLAVLGWQGDGHGYLLWGKMLFCSHTYSGVIVSLCTAVLHEFWIYELGFWLVRFEMTWAQWAGLEYTSMFICPKLQAHNACLYVVVVVLMYQAWCFNLWKVK